MSEAGWIAIAAMATTILTTLIGWIVTHRMTLAAQDRQRLAARRDEGRVTLVRLLRRHQEWVLELARLCTHVSLYIARAETHHGSGDDWKAVHGWLLRVLDRHDDRADWILGIEEHEDLYPEISGCRGDLIKRQHELERDLVGLRLGLEAYCDKSDRPFAARVLNKGSLSSLTDRLQDENGLIEDLRLFVQYRAHGPLTERAFNRLPTRRRPTEPGVPRLVLRGAQLLLATSEDIT